MMFATGLRCPMCGMAIVGRYSDMVCDCAYWIYVHTESCRECGEPTIISESWAQSRPHRLCPKCDQE